MNVNEVETKAGKRDQQQYDQKLVTKVEKFSARGFSFHDRLVYIDDTEIRYYSAVPKNFKKNDFTKVFKLPKMGVPTALCEIMYP